MNIKTLFATIGAMKGMKDRLVIFSVGLDEKYVQQKAVEFCYATSRKMVEGVDKHDA